MAKEFAYSFYNSMIWRKTKKSFLHYKNNLCERCLKSGIITPATLVHHKKYITPENIHNTDITLNYNNLEALCQDCHNKEHHRDNTVKKRYIFLPNGELSPLIS